MSITRVTPRQAVRTIAKGQTFPIQAATVQEAKKFLLDLFSWKTGHFKPKGKPKVEVGRDNKALILSIQMLEGCYFEALFILDEAEDDAGTIYNFVVVDIQELTTLGELLDSSEAGMYGSTVMDEGETRIKNAAKLLWKDVESNSKEIDRIEKMMQDYNDMTTWLAGRFEELAKNTAPRS